MQNQVKKDENNRVKLESNHPCDQVKKNQAKKHGLLRFFRFGG